MIVLVDHNIEGQAILLWGLLGKEGWLKLLPVQLVTLAEVGLSVASSDREVWRFAQTHQMILLTGNRRRRGSDSLEQTIREENMPTSLPVITISSLHRLDERSYRERCGSRLIEILIDIDNYVGVGRIFIP
jgi:uncharacterized protein DUF5615